MPHVPPKQLAELMRKAETSPQPVVEVPLASGGRLRYRKSVSTAVTAQVESEERDGQVSVIVRVFAALPTQPSEYPPSVPFLPDEEVTISETTDGIVSAWRPLDVTEAFEQVRTACKAAGWKESPPNNPKSSMAFLGVQLVEFRRADRLRALSSMAVPVGAVTLVEGLERRSSEDPQAS